MKLIGLERVFRRVFEARQKPGNLAVEAQRLEVIEIDSFQEGFQQKPENLALEAQRPELIEIGRFGKSFQEGL